MGVFSNYTYSSFLFGLSENEVSNNSSIYTYDDGHTREVSFIFDDPDAYTSFPGYAIIDNIENGPKITLYALYGLDTIDWVDGLFPVELIPFYKIEIEYDTGVNVLELRKESGSGLRTITDAIGEESTAAWSEKKIVYDMTDNIFSDASEDISIWQRKMDDGTFIVRDYDNGSKTAEAFYAADKADIIADPMSEMLQSDSFNFIARGKTFDEDGDMSGWSKIYDDGDVLSIAYTDGVRDFAIGYDAEAEEYWVKDWDAEGKWQSKEIYDDLASIDEAMRTDDRIMLTLDSMVDLIV